MREIELDSCVVAECSPSDYEQLTIEVTFLRGKGYEDSFFTLNQDLGPDDVYIEFYLGKKPGKMKLNDFKKLLATAEKGLLMPEDYVDPTEF